MTFHVTSQPSRLLRPGEATLGVFIHVCVFCMLVLCMQFRGSFSFLEFIIVFIINSYCLPCILANKDYCTRCLSKYNNAYVYALQ